MPLRELDFDPFADDAAPTTSAAPKATKLVPLDFDPFEDEAPADQQSWFKQAADRAKSAIGSTAVGRGFTAGLLEQSPQNFGDALEGFGYLGGSDWAKEQGANLREWGQNSLAPELKTKGKGILDSTSISDFLTNAGETFGSGLASMAPNIGAGLGGAAAGGAAGSIVGPGGTVAGGIGGGLVGAGSVSYVQAYGELYGALKEAGVDPQRAAEFARGPAALIAAPDVASLGKMASMFTGTARKEIVQGIARRIATNAAQGMAVEGATEAAQEAIKEAAVSYETGRPWTGETAKQIGEAAVGGALVGGGLGGASGIRKPAAPVAEPAQPVMQPGEPWRPTITPEPRLVPNPLTGDPNDPVDLNGPELSEGDLASPIKNLTIQKGKEAMDRLIGAGPQPASAPPAGFEPLYSDENESEQIGWINPRTNEIRKLDEAAAPEAQGVEGEAAAPVVGAEGGAAAPEAQAPVNPDAADAPMSDWQRANRDAAVDLARRLGVIDRIADMAKAGKTAKEISAELGGSLDADEVRAVRDSLGIQPAGPMAGVFMKPTDTGTPAPGPQRGEVVKVKRDDGREVSGTVAGVRPDGKVEVTGDLGGKVSVAPEAIVKPEPEPEPAPAPIEAPSPTPAPVAQEPINAPAPKATTFTTAKGSTYVVHEDGTTSRNKAARDDVGHEGDSGAKKRSARTVYVDTNAAELSAAGLSLARPDKGARVVFDGQGRAALLTWNEKANRWGKSSEWLPTTSEPGVGRYPLELWNKTDDVPGFEAYGRMHAGNPITAMGTEPAAEAAPVTAPEPVAEAPAPKPDILTPVSKRPKAAKPAPEAKPAKKLPKKIGENADGNPLFEDDRGVRSFVSDGVRQTEKVAVAPDGSVSIRKDERGSRFSTQSEVNAAQAPQATPEQVAALTPDVEKRARAMVDDGKSVRAIQFTLEDEGLSKADVGKATKAAEERKKEREEESERAAAASEAKRRPEPTPAEIRKTSLKTGTPPVEDDRERQRREKIRKAEAMGAPLVAGESKKPADFGANNKVFTKDAADKAREILRKKLSGSQLNSGLDPEVVQAGISLAGYYIEAGTRKFADFTKAMVDDLGEGVRPYLRSWYEGVRYYPNFDAQGMSSAAEIENEGKTDGRPGERSDLGEAAEPETRPDVAEGQSDGEGRSGDVEAPPAEDAGGTPKARRSRGSGTRSRGSRDRGGEAVSPGGDGGDGRGGDRGTGVAAEGTGDGGRPRDVEQPPATRPNYFVADPESLIGGTPKVRFARNRSAIEAYRAITEEGRDPTQEELDAMAGYIGWGSFGQELFQGNWERPRPRDGWQNEDRWLREHLGKDEWESAQRSIINAHYTDPPTVKAMWDMVKRMGFKGGRVLEPSMGIGNFFGMMPRDLMAKSNLTGIELDSLTGGMAKLLYPQANISIKGYQDSQTPDNFYDLVIGNWPFAADGPSDRRYNNISPSLHDYFFLKALDQVRPGGIVIGITSAGTMDKAGTNVRRELALKAELVASFRLPSGAFEKYAGTAVVTDIIVLKKREAPATSVANETWVNATPVKMDGGEIRVNDYYLSRPQDVLGRLGYGHGTTYGRAGMIVERPADFMDRLVALPERVPKGVYEPKKRGKETRFVSNNTTDRTGAITVSDGKLYAVQGERLAVLEDVLRYKTSDTKKTAAREDQLKRLVDLRRKYGALIDAERDGAANVEDLRRDLKKSFDGFRKAHGPIADSDGLSLFRRAKDPYTPAVAALETPDGKPSRILTEATVRSRRKLENPSIKDAFVMARNQTRDVDLEEVARIAKRPVAEVTKELLGSKAVYRTPGDGFEVADVYLSGNVRRKLREAQEALDRGEDMEASIEALKAVVPKDIPYFQIEAKLGATWVDNNTYRRFVADLLGVPDIDENAVRYSGGSWRVKFHPHLNNRPEAQATWGMGQYRFNKLLTAAMNNTTVTIRYKDDDGNLVVDTEATKEAADKIAKIREEFSAWVWRDAERRVNLERAYNEIMNAVATPKYDGSFLEFPGMALRRGEDQFSLRSHQVNAIWRGIANQRGLFAHEVGTGKTYTMAGIAVESRRYGIARKPMIIAHNANSATVAREINDMYPGAQVLYVDNLSPDTIDVTMRRIANEDWDAVVIPHSLVDRMAMSEATLKEMAAEEIAALEQEAREAAQEDGIDIDNFDLDDEKSFNKMRSPTAKDLVKQRLRVVEKIKEWGQRAAKEGAVNFEDLGVDMVIVDEAHEFKKPPIATKMKMRGFNTQTSNRSIALNFLTGYVKKINGGKGVHLFTGTPITNTLTEIFNMMRFTMSDEMKLNGVDTWDAWFNTFADSTSDVELTPTGEYEPITRLAAFVNVAELRRMAGQYMDIVFADDMPEFKPRPTSSGKILTDDLTAAERKELEEGRSEKPVGRPYKRVISDVAPMGEAQEAILQVLIARARMFRNASGKERREMQLAGHPAMPVRVETDAANAGLDPRLADENAADEPASKVNRAVRNLVDIYKGHPQATQVVFMERGFSDTSTVSAGRDETGKKLRKKVERFNLVKDMIEKLVAAGVKREEIAVVDGKTSKEKRKETADKMNRSEIRVVIGSTDTLGVGVNMQANLRAMHHLDAPWMPGELEQRNGRGHRQGNKWNTVLEYRYITEKLDGRRWQVLLVKDRFIKAFLRADESVRVIEGDAVSSDEKENADSLADTLSQAAGDPRLLIMNKLAADIDKLENRERTHSFGVVDARSRAKRERENIEGMRARLPDWQDDARHWAAIREKGTFSATIQGKTFDERKAAQEAIDNYVRTLAPGVDTPTIGEIQGFTLTLNNWVRTVDGLMPRYTVSRKSNFSTNSASVASVEGLARGVDKRIADAEAEVGDKEASIGRLEEAGKAPFGQAATLAKKRAMLKDVKADLSANPVPAPSWLRLGAPVGTEVFVDDERRVVEGHRWTKEDWLVTTDNGEVSYLDVRDQNGSRLYEGRPFTPPEVVDSTAPAAPPTVANAMRERGEAKVSARERREVEAIVRRIAGPGVKLRLDEPIPTDPDAARASGGTANTVASGSYDGVDDVMHVAVGLGEISRLTAAHESFHRLEFRKFFTEAEMVLMEAETERMRAAVKKANPFLDTPAMPGYEVRAYAFELYEADRRAGKLSTWLKAPIRTAFDRLYRIIRAVRAYLAGRGFKTYEDVFEAAARGDVAKRAPRTEPRFDGTAFSMRRRQVAEAQDENSLFGDFGVARRGVVETITKRNVSFLASMKQAATSEAFAETMDSLRYWFQDLVVDLKKFQREIETALGRKLTQRENAYLAHELHDSASGVAIKRLDEEFLSPLSAEIKKQGLTQDEVEAYLYARHAPERNARIASINPRIPEAGSGMSDEEAADIMAEARRSGKLAGLQSVARIVDRLQRFAQQTRVEFGLLSQEQADAMAEAYEFYVPLRGFEEMDPDVVDDGPSTGGSGVNVRGPESRMAFGRRSKATNILAYSMMQAMEAIHRGHKNTVGNAIMELAESAPNRDVWEVDRVEVRAVFNKTTGLVEYRPTRRLTPKEEDNTVYFKRDGKMHRITFNANNPRAARLARGLRKMDARDFQFMVKTLGSVTRYLSLMNTGMNPEFVISNAIRDLETAGISLQQHEIDGLIKGVRKDFFRAAWASIKGAYGRRNGDWGRWYNEFELSGAKSSWNSVESVEEIQERLVKALGKPPSKLNVWHQLKTIRDAILSLNDGVENGIRLAVYKNARTRGLSSAQAASIAKNVTVNFNRRGAAGPAVNSLYMFANASIQGTAAVATSLRSARVRKAVGVLIGMGVSIAVFNMLMGGDDDDGQPIYDKIPEFEKEKNFIIMAPWTEKGYIKFPLLQGYGWFFTTGRLMAETSFGRKKPGEAAADMATSFVDAFNPVGGTNSLLNFIAPTVLDPVADIWQNRDFADRPIRPINKFDENVPRAQSYWNTVNPIAKGATDKITDWTGGDKVRPGAIDVSPEHVEYGVGVIFGAAGNFIMRNVGLVGKMYSPETQGEATINDYPFVRRVLGEKGPWIDRSLAYDRMQEIEKQRGYVKKYAKEGEIEKAEALSKEEEKVLGMARAAEVTRDIFSNIRKARNAVYADYFKEKITAAERNEELKLLAKREEEAVIKFNKRWNEKVEGIKPPEGLASP